MGSTNDIDLSDAKMMAIFYEKLNKVNSLEKELHQALKDFALFRDPAATSCILRGDVIKQDKFEIELEWLTAPPKWFHLPFWKAESI